MTSPQLSKLLMDQSKDLFWMIGLDLQLIYANKTYFNLIKENTGIEKKLNESVLVESYGEGYNEKWKVYYTRVLNGEYFEIEEHYYHPESNEIKYNQISFEPLTGDDNKIFAAACQSKDITRIVKQKSEANQLIDSSLDVFCTVDEHGNFVNVSAAALKHWGYSPEELKGTPYVDLILEEDLPKTHEIAAAILNGQEIKSFVNRYKKKDGGIAYNLWSARFDTDTKLMYAVARDGKEKIEQEEKILTSEQRFKALVQECSDMISIIDSNGKYVYTSPTTTAILGITPEEFDGKTIFDFIHPDDIEKASVYMQRINTESKVFVEPFRLRAKNKEWRWIETVLTNMMHNPAVKGIVANSRDITDQIEEKQKLKLLESVITNTKDAILITEAEPFDQPGPKILFVNDAFTKMTGYSAAEVIGKTPRILQGPNSDKEELAKLSRAIRNWEPCEITIINYKKNGEEFWLNFNLSPVADEKGWYTHWISIDRDVTEQKIKELENELLAHISVNFNAQNDYIIASNEVCKSISKFGKFDLVELWISNLEKSKMQLFSHFAATPDDERFYEYSDVQTFKMSEGLAGKVWAEKTQILWNDIENNNDFVRKNAAKKIGIKAVLGIPLIFNDEVVGVLKIGTKHSGNYFKKYTPIFKRLEGFIGSELNRKKLEYDLSHLYDAIPDVICLIDFEARFLRINKAGCTLMGFNEEAILYHRFEEFVHNEDKRIFANEVMQLKKEDTSFKFETRQITITGETVWLSWFCNSVVNEKLIYATAKNITEEKKLRELNRQASRLAKIGSWEVDVVNQKVFWSDEVHEMHETDPKSFVPNLEIGINFYREDFRKMVESKVERSIATGEPFDFEAVLVTATKKELWVRSIGNADFADGVCTRIYGSFQDINVLKESENRLISLSENIPGVIYQYIIYPDGTDAIQFILGGVEELWGYTIEEIMGDINLLWNQIKLGGDLEAVKASISKAVQTKSQWTCRFKCVMPNGALKTHLGNGTPSFLADGSIVFNVIILDITQEAKNENLLTQASEMSRIGSWELDLLNQNGDSMYWSPMVKEIFEVDESYKPTLASTMDFYLGENKVRKQLVTNLLIKEGVEFDDEFLLLTKKGNERWIRCIGKSEMADNKRTKIYGSFQDINERKKSEIKLAESENRFRTILEAEPECIKLLGPGGELLMMNPAGLGMIEADNEGQVIGKSLLDILLPTHRSAFSKLTKNVFNGESGMLVFEIEGLKGTRRWLETHAVPLKSQNGEIISLLSVTRDITERKKAEEIILQSNERYEKVTEATNDAIWDWDILNQTYHRSKAIERFFGKESLKSYSNNDFWKEHFHPEDLAKIQKSIYDAFDNPLTNRWELEYRVFNENGKILYVIDRGVIIRDKDGKAIRMVGAMTNISEQKQMTIQLSELNNSLQQHASELERSNEELEQFAFVASHDLQEPLRMITSFMDQLKRKYNDQLDEKAQQYIHFATDGAKRLKQIILDLLEYSRASRPTEGKEEVDMNEIFSEFKKLRRQLISETKATITSNKLPILNTYKAVITQILHCLLDNALKYYKIGTPPIVEITAVENENQFNFSIKDNGIGIDSQFYDKIFIIFQRLHNKDEYSGSGIGLSIAKRHVEFLGGRIWLESTKGEGSIFYFTISTNK